MPGKTARALCPVCQEPMPPDETECENCGAFVIDEAVVRLCRALGIPREKALALFEKGFRNPKQLQDRDVDDVLQSGENGLLFLCTNCGGFVATGDPKCPRCGAEFEEEPEATEAETDILDLILCPVCCADNEPTWKECEICGEPLGGTEEPPGSEPEAEPAKPAPEPSPAVASPALAAPPAASPATASTLDRIDDILKDLDRPSVAKPEQKTGPVAKLARIRKRVKPSATPALPAVAPSTPEVPAPPSAPTAVAPKPRPRPRARDLRPLARPVPRPVAAEPNRTTTPSMPGPTPAARGTRRTILRRREGTALPPDLSGGLVVAGTASLYLAVTLGEALLAWAVGAVMILLLGYIASGLLNRRERLPGRTEILALLAGALLAAGAPALHQTYAPAASVAGAVALALATRRLLKTRSRNLIAAASALPVASLAVIAALGYTFAGSPAWVFGLLALVPWPAAVAVEGVRERQATLRLGRELSKAETHMERAEYAASVRDFDRAIAVTGQGTPGAETPWYGKGASLILMGQYEEALRAIDRALDLNPRNEVAWLNKGNAYTKMGRLPDALRCFNAAIQVNPDYEVAWNNKGNTFARLGRYDDALSCYDRALELDPEYRGAWVNKGYVLTKMGRYEEATSCADRALRLNRRTQARPA